MHGSSVDPQAAAAPRTGLAAGAEHSVSMSGGSLTLVAVVLLIALLALGTAAYFRQEVLTASEGTPCMLEIALAVQEGAAAYLSRQFRTLAVFVGLVFLLLFALP